MVYRFRKPETNLRGEIPGSVEKTLSVRRYAIRLRLPDTGKG